MFALVKRIVSFLISMLMIFSAEYKNRDMGDSSVVYVNAQTGSDSASGTFVFPVKTISQAVKLTDGKRMTVRIAEGTYPETVEITKDGITVEGDGNVTVTGGDALTGKWEKYKGHIYRTKVENKVESVFCDGSQMLIARWPNTSYKDLCRMKRAQSDEGTGMTTLVDSKLPKKLDLTGAKLTIWNGSAWVTCFREITSCKEGKSFSWEEPIRSYTDDNPEGMDCYVPHKNNYYYVSDKLELLDKAGEWYYDSESQMLYFYAPNGRNPEKSNVSIKTRDYAFVLNGADDVTLRNINIFGCGIDCHADRCTFDRVNVKCCEFFIDANMFDNVNSGKNAIYGKENIWKNSEISDTWGSGITVFGDNNTIENCHFHDFDYAGTYYAGVNVYGTGNTVKNCTLHDTGRYNILHSGAKKLTVTGCDMYNSALLSEDLGSIYSWGTDGEGTEIAYNYVHDNKEVGIYIDNNCSNYYVHDNVIKNNGIGITLNSQLIGCTIENNYLLKNDRTSSTYFYEKDGPSMAGSVIRGNVYTGKWQLVEGENAPLFENNRLVKSAIGVKLPDREYGCDFA